MSEKYGVYWKGELVEGEFDTKAEAQTFINTKSTEMEFGDYTPSELERFWGIKPICSVCGGEMHSFGVDSFGVEAWRCSKCKRGYLEKAGHHSNPGPSKFEVGEKVRVIEDGGEGVGIVKGKQFIYHPEYWGTARKPHWAYEIVNAEETTLDVGGNWGENSLRKIRSSNPVVTGDEGRWWEEFHKVVEDPEKRKRFSERVKEIARKHKLEEEEDFLTEILQILSGKHPWKIRSWDEFWKFVEDQAKEGAGEERRTSGQIGAPSRDEERRIGVIKRCLREAGYSELSTTKSHVKTAKYSTGEIHQEVVSIITDSYLHKGMLTPSELAMAERIINKVKYEKHVGPSDFTKREWTFIMKVFKSVGKKLKPTK